MGGVGSVREDRPVSSSCFMVDGTRFDVCVINYGHEFAFWGLCKVDHGDSILQIGGIATIVQVWYSRARGAAGENLPRTRSVWRVKGDFRAKSSLGMRVVGINGQLKEIMGI